MHYYIHKKYNLPSHTSVPLFFFFVRVFPLPFGSCREREREREIVYRWEAEELPEGKRWEAER
jgi:hypothetical protein